MRLVQARPTTHRYVTRATFPAVRVGAEASPDRTVRPPLSVMSDGLGACFWRPLTRLARLDDRKRAEELVKDMPHVGSDGAVAT